MIAFRLAPIAARTATSRRRAMARDSSRLATLPHAISSTTPTAAISITTLLRNSPTTRSRSGLALIPMFGSASGMVAFCSRYC